MRIGITGAQSVGKTTLLNALRSEDMFKDLVICDEVTRRVKSYGLPINEDGNDTTQRLIMNEHVVNVFLYDNMIADRTVLDGLVYSSYLYRNGKVNMDTFKYVYDVYEKVVPYYDYIFYIEPEFDIVNDGTRSVDLSFRDQVADLFESLIYQHKLDVIRIGGSVRNRVNQIIDIIEKDKE